MPNYTNLKGMTGGKRCATNLKKLRIALDHHISSSCTSDHTCESVRIATWNIRDFGKGKYKGRDTECLYYIAEIISHFHIVALQEISGNMKQFKNLYKILGKSWDYIATDVSDGDAGNGERMVFLFNRTKVWFRNIAGELTLSGVDKIRSSFGERIKLENGIKVKLPAGADLSGIYNASLKTSSGGKKLAADLEIPLPAGTTLELTEACSVVVTKNTVVASPGRGKAKVDLGSDLSAENLRLRFPNETVDDSYKQFARTPFLISFQTGWLKINLCTVHIFYGSASDNAKLEQRRSEIEKLTNALAKKAKDEFKEDDESFLGVLGDFNIIGKGHPTMKALENSGFEIPEALKKIPGSNVKKDKAYDQIAFWEPRRETKYAKLDIRGANVFDFFEHIFTDEEEPIYRLEGETIGLKTSSKYDTWRTYKMSDHLPMWIELRSDFTDEYLDGVIGDG